MDKSRPISFLEHELNKGNTNKVCRFLLGTLSVTPIIGGIIGASAAAWGETEQSKINQLITTALTIHDDEITELKGTLVSAKNPDNWVAAHLRFNPHTRQVISRSNVTSLTTFGTRDFALNFALPINDDVVLQYFGNGPLSIVEVSRSSTSVRIRLSEDCPDLVSLAFFKVPRASSD